jgi:hypothetical protein
MAPVPATIHITFATAQFSQSRRVLRRSARRYGVNLRIYGPEHPIVRLAHDENPKIMSRKDRGAGYWLWKPYIILDTLTSVPEGTLVLYTDVAVTYIADPSKLFEFAASRDVTLFDNLARFKQEDWTKRDCFVLLDADAEPYWNRTQLDAAFQIYRAGTPAIEFVQACKRAMRDSRILTDEPNVCGRPDPPGVREDHRHDQSVLTIFTVRYGLPSFRSPSRQPAATESAPSYPQVFFHHRRRDVRFDKHVRDWLKGRYHRPRQSPTRAMATD